VSQLNEQLASRQAGVALSGALQALPQAPQLAGSEPTSTQEFEQSRVPCAHDKLQLPPVHTSFAAQRVAQSPQCSLLDLVSTQAPPQFVVPLLQRMSQLEALHTAVPFAGLSHLVPQAPQLRGSELSATQTPLQRV
jgi:hypothetical protein